MVWITQKALMLARYKILNAALLVVLLPASLLSFTSTASAQGLGELTLESTLNEPLLATIELLDVAGLNESQIELSIATPEEYEEAGLEFSVLASSIDLDVELLPPARGVVTLTTAGRVEEPFLYVLLRARWPSGTVLRDYTILLDLPTRADSGTQPAAEAPTAGISGAVTSQSPAGAASGGNEAYSVQTGDTLWEIAEQTRPSGDVTVQQMMVAIQRANEDAFVNNNINRLLNGRVLRIPSQQEIGIIEHNAAVAQINSQNEQLGATPLGGTGTGAPAAPARDELSVLSGDEDLAAGAGSSDLEATIAALENELMLSEEDLDRALIENVELTAQLDALEEQISILENIIAIEDERIAQLQTELAAQAEATDQAVAETGKAENLLAAAGQSGQPAGLMGMLQNNVVMIGATLFVVLLVLGYLFYRARRAQMFEEDELAFMGEQGSASIGSNTRTDEAAEQGFLASLMARFRRHNSDDEYEDDIEPIMPDTAYMQKPQGAEIAATAPGAEQAADAADDEMANLRFAEEDYFPGEDEDDNDDSEALAGSVLSEVEKALQQVDSQGFDEVGAFEDNDAVSSPATEPLVVESATAALDAVDAEVEFDVPSGVSTSAVGVQTATPEVFEFTLKKDAAPAAEVVAEEPEHEFETFAFNPTSSKSDDSGMDLASFTFDENDARLASEGESEYKPRSNMDECDTKLDLAVAYEAMGDVEGAVEILDEIIAEGKPAQVDEAQRLKIKWQES
jgi:FimV-like protein